MRRRKLIAQAQKILDEKGFSREDDGTDAMRLVIDAACIELADFPDDIVTEVIETRWPGADDRTGE